MRTFLTIFAISLAILATTDDAFAQRRRDPKKNDPEAPARKRLADLLVKEIERRATAISSVLGKYNQIEARRKWPDKDRYDLHRRILDSVITTKSDKMVSPLKRLLKKSPSNSTYPGHVLLLKSLVDGKYPLERKERVDILRKKATGKNFRLQVWGVRLLGQARWSEAVDALIDIMDAEERNGRSSDALWHMVSTELFRVLGHHAVGSAVTIRAKWEKAGKKLPKKPKYSNSAKGRGGAGATMVFFGAKISPRSVFAIDTSSSMRQNASISTGSGRRTETKKEREKRRGKSEPKIDVVKRELAKAVAGLQPEFKFNILAYNSSFAPWRGSKSRIKLQNASADTVKDAKKYAENLGTDTGTNIFDTMEAALQVPDVDTVYLLSDGQPSRGGGPPEIEKMVAYKNYLRGIRVVTFAIIPENGKGFDEAFMKRLARNHWGWYRRLNDG